jgi:vacuolar-type H+-ATPase catalytic subunit A/Vma1
VLSVFEPGQKHEISINEKDYPDKYKPVIRKLLKAMQDEKVRETMEIEDEILEELKLKERIAEKALLIADAEKKEKEKALVLAKRERKEKEKERREKEIALEREKETKIKLARKMLKYGESIEEIASETGLSIPEIKKLKSE